MIKLTNKKINNNLKQDLKKVGVKMTVPQIKEIYSRLIKSGTLQHGQNINKDEFINILKIQSEIAEYDDYKDTLDTHYRVGQNLGLVNQYKSFEDFVRKVKSGDAPDLYIYDCHYFAYIRADPNQEKIPGKHYVKYNDELYIQVVSITTNLACNLTEEQFNEKFYRKYLCKYDLDNTGFYEFDTIHYMRHMFDESFNNLSYQYEMYYVKEMTLITKPGEVVEPVDKLERLNKLEVCDENSFTYKLYSTKYINPFEKQPYITKDECAINAILNNYKDNEKQKQCIITRNKILNVINLTEDEIKNGISIKQLIPLFEYYNLRVLVIDELNNKVYERDGSDNIKKLYMMIKNGHLYLLNNYVKEIDNLESDSDFVVNKPSPNFKCCDEETSVDYIMINDVHDVKRIYDSVLNSQSEDMQRFSLCPKNNDLSYIVYQLFQMGIEPYVLCSSKRIERALIHIYDKKQQRAVIEIRCQELFFDNDDSVIITENERKLNLMHTLTGKLRSYLFKSLWLSHYNETDKHIFNTCYSIPISGKVEHCDTKNLVNIDINKAYTSYLTKIKKIPVFNTFDHWKPYNGQEIEDYNMYIAQGDGMFFNRDKTLVYGFVLKQLNYDSIMYYKKPSNIYYCDFNGVIGEIYKSDLDAHMKKSIVNVCIGMLGKKYNKNYKSIIFNNRIDAVHMLKKYDGYVSSFKSNEQQKDEMFVYTKKCTTELNNGFNYIFEMIIQLGKLNVVNTLKILDDNQIPFYQIKTDSITIEYNESVEKLLDFGNKIGQWKYEPFSYFMNPFYVMPSYLDEIIEHKIERVEFEDEYDMKPIHKFIEEKRLVMIRAKFAGSGKSFVAKSMTDKRVLFVCPSNFLTFDVKYNADDVEAITANSFFGINVDSKQIKPCFDVDGYDVIVFDEILFLNMQFLSLIKRFIDDNPDKIIIANGDAKQLENFQIELNNIKDKETYLNDVVNSMFNYEIYLKEIKRMNKEEDKEKLKNVYSELFEKHVKPIDVMKKYFKPTNKLMEGKNICYFNKTCQTVSKQYRKEIMNIHSENFIVGEEVLCKKYIKLVANNMIDGNLKQINVNCKFRISDIQNNDYILTDEFTGFRYRFSVQLVNSRFISATAITAHSSQGISFDSNVIVFDVKSNLVNANWLYVSCTRSRNMSNVYYYENKTEDDFKFYAIKKLSGYKTQDAKREYNPSDYIDVQYILDGLKSCCKYCNIKLDDDNLTIDRVNDEYAHVKTNCCYACVDCNVAHFNKLV
jgi:hypothetical protein